MKWAMTTVSYRYHLYSFNNIVSIAQQCGFDGIELWEPHLIRNQSEIFDYVERDSPRIPINICSAYLDLTDFSRRSDSWEDEIFAKLLCCKRLGVSVLRLFTGRLASADAGEEVWQKWLDRINRIEAYSQQLEMDVVFESHPGTLLDKVSGVEKFINGIEKYGWGRIGINFDVFHVWEYGVDVLQYLQHWFPYVKHVHLKNAYRKTQQFNFSNVYHPMGEYDDVSPLFDGVVHMKEIIEFLCRNQYDGNATLEHFAAPSMELFSSELECLNKLVSQNQQVTV